MPGAFDDAEIVYLPDPKDPATELVLLGNKNRNKTIAANVKLTAGREVKVLNLDRSSRELFPQEFKITIQAGARQLIGRRHFNLPVSLKAPKIEVIALTYVIQGAVYVEDEPQPPPHSEVHNYLALLEIDQPVVDPKNPSDLGMTWVFAINLSHQYRLQASLVSTTTPPEWFSTDLGIFSCVIAHGCDDIKIRRGWTVERGRLIPEFAPFE
ncbi:hypothetical protein Rleg2_2423 [Rhizobium leguminosarum bv. trifolii WSM2304]|uniref:Uncharacterized protein n=1 Tax=Rhizobium leguminosarum bv. trifolii (strain WSM2304) TaxID=395492 RepID=A0ABF7QNU3_RHILW|nr:hypothetical protein [Rhizobium leguminosarum]ACI55697.1 hypothetical protein Rleg2_2423 [Rhizobium leguminosarum bv. trifolii WSM2304]